MNINSVIIIISLGCSFGLSTKKCSSDICDSSVCTNYPNAVCYLDEWYLQNTKKHVTKWRQNETYTYNVLHIWNLGTIVSMDECTCNCLIKYSVEWYLFKFSRSNKVYVEVALITYAW